MKRLANIENFEQLNNSSDSARTVWNGFSKEEVMPGGSARKYFTPSERKLIDRAGDRDDFEYWANPGLSYKAIQTLQKYCEEGVKIEGLDDAIASGPLGDSDSTRGLDTILYGVSEGQISPANALALVKMWDPEARYGAGNNRVEDAVYGCLRRGVPENEIMQAMSGGMANAGPALEELANKYA